MKAPLVIASRGSDLALWQANHVGKMLEKAGVSFTISIVKTQGDLVQHLSLDKLEGKGFFTKEIEEALLRGEADIAVHSFKDLPTEMHPELLIAAVPGREDPSELLLIRKDSVNNKEMFSLKRNAVVGTSSARRKSQLLAFRTDLQIKDLRGNVPTRVQKLLRGDYDAILVAAAGVERLDLDVSGLHSEKINPKSIIPAPAQGALAIQVNKNRTELIVLLKELNDEKAQATITAEREVLALFKAGCHAPVGAYCMFDEEEEQWLLWACHADDAGKLPVSASSYSKDPAVLASRVVDKINKVRPARVFISRNRKKDDYLFRVLEANGFSISGFPLIEFREVPFLKTPQTDWIFFSSKNAVDYFFAQQPEIHDQQFGCIGSGTAAALRAAGHQAAFIGSSTDTRIAGKQFAALVGRSKVLFPQARNSVQSIQKQLPAKEQAINLVVYETLTQVETALPEADIFIFTSPSNVASFLEKFKLPQSVQLIAMGQATANELKKAGRNIFAIPDAFDDPAIARVVFSLSSKRNEP